MKNQYKVPLSAPLISIDDNLVRKGARGMITSVLKMVKLGKSD